MKAILLILTVALIVSVFGKEKRLEEICGRSNFNQSAWNQTFVRSEEWPWHVLVQMKQSGFYFDGTLISRNLVLTVASYVTDRGNPYKPDHLKVVLNPGGDKQVDKEVQKVIVHEQYTSNKKSHNIALLKLKDDVEINDFVQPSCVWSKNKSTKYILPSFQIGTVIGYAYGNDVTLRSPLRKNTMPIVSQDKCKASNEESYSEYLTDDKFCAENLKDATICISDTGAPYQVFVPDNYRQTYGPGAWYVRGLLQHIPLRGPTYECNPEEYFVFTDVEKFYDWIQTQIKDNE